MRKLAQLLLDRGAKANESTLLVFASQAGSQKWVQWILDSGIDIDRHILQEAAVEASRYGDVKTMGLLVDGRPEIDNALLEGACHFGHEKMMCLLLGRGADVTNDVLAIAYDRAHYKVMQLLLDEGAKATSEALERASKQRHLKVVESLLDRGAQVTFISI